MLDYGIVCIGPGRFGPFTASQHVYEEKGLGRGKIKSFAQNLRLGDWIVAKQGLSKVLAVGLVTSDYLYSNELDDVEGWDLQHYRTVDWWVPLAADGNISYVKLEGRKLTQSAFCRVGIPSELILQLRSHVWSVANKLRNIVDAFNQFVPLSGFLSLAKEGLAEQLTNTIRWYVANDYNVSEYELTCHCVVPFLKLLGWRTGQIKLEFGRVDVMLFENDLGHLTKEEVPKVIIEVKRFGNGLTHTGFQAMKYYNRVVENMPEDATPPVLAVTNGMRWNILEPLGDGNQRVKGGFSLGRLRERDAVWAGDVEPSDTWQCLNLLRP